MSYHSEAPEFLVEFLDKAQDVLVKELGLQNEAAELAAHELANMIVTNWAGTMPYIPKGQALFISKRDQQLFTEFNGTNHNELAQKYGISVQWVYRVVKRARAAYINQVQKGLFDDTQGK